MLSVRCPVCLPVCDVRALWPNGWTDQHETWHTGRPRPWPHCVRWGPSSPPPMGHSPQFSAHVSCGQMAAWIKMSLGMELGLGPGDFVLEWDPAPLPKRETEPPIFGPCLLWPNGGMDAAGTWHGGRPQPRRLCVRWGGPSPPSPKGGGAPCPIFGPFLFWPNGWMHQGATWYECRPQPRGLCVRWRPSSPSPKGGGPPIFGPCLLWPNGWMDQDATWHEDMPQTRGVWVRWGSSPSPKREAEAGGRVPQFSAHGYCGRMAGWIKMALGTEVGLGPVHIVLDGDTALLPKTGGRAPQIFGPSLLWPNGWMHQDATGYGGRPWPTRHCVRCGPSYLQKKGTSTPPNFWPMSIVAKWLDG